MTTTEPTTETAIAIAGLRTVAVGDRDAARIVVVLLHGFAMEPADLSPFAHSIRVPAWFLFPEAPLPAEPRGRAWWHIDATLRAAALERGPRDFAGQHPPDLPAARASLDAFLDEVKALTGDRPVVVGGFSQGGMLVSDTLLRRPRPIDGLLLLSSSRIAYADWPPLLAASPLLGVPAVISHGAADADLALATGEALRDAMLAAGADVTWVPFPDGHEIPLVVWRHIRKLLLAIIARR